MFESCTGATFTGQVVRDAAPVAGRRAVIVEVGAAPDDKAALFDPMADKIYRHPTFYELPDEVNHM